MSAAAGTGNTAPVLTTVTVLLFLWASCGYLVRVYVKISQSDGWKPDDWAITGAMIAALAQLIAVSYAVNRGYGMPWDAISSADQAAVQKSLYAGEIIYIAAVGAARISASLFIAIVLARDPRNILVSRALTGLCVAWTVAAIFTVALRGVLDEPWTILNGSQSMYMRWIGIEAAGVALDVTAAGIVVYFIHDLQMKTGKKIAVGCILNSRVLIAAPIALRLHYLHPNLGPDGALTATMIRQVIIGCNILASALTCLKPFLKPFDAAAFGSGLGGGSRPGLFGYINQPGSGGGKHATYYELSTPGGGGSGGGGSGNRKSTVVQSQRSVLGSSGHGGGGGGEDDELPLREHAAVAPRLPLHLRPDGLGFHTAEVSRQTGARGLVGPSSGGRGEIEKTQTFSVSRG